MCVIKRKRARWFFAFVICGLVASGSAIARPQSSQKNRAIVAADVSAATECIANVMQSSDIRNRREDIQALAEGILIRISLGICRTEIRAMMKRRDRIHGVSGGDAFFRDQFLVIVTTRLIGRSGRFAF
jgi:hypothetical protein